MIQFEICLVKKALSYMIFLRKYLELLIRNIYLRKIEQNEYKEKKQKDKKRLFTRS
jgi:hypothetical protein